MGYRSQFVNIAIYRVACFALILLGRITESALRFKVRYGLKAGILQVPGSFVIVKSATWECSKDGRYSKSLSRKLRRAMQSIGLDVQ